MSCHCYYPSPHAVNNPSYLPPTSTCLHRQSLASVSLPCSSCDPGSPTPSPAFRTTRLFVSALSLCFKGAAPGQPGSLEAPEPFDLPDTDTGVMTLGQSLPTPAPQSPHLSDGITASRNSGITHSIGTECPVATTTRQTAPSTSLDPCHSPNGLSALPAPKRSHQAMAVPPKNSLPCSLLTRPPPALRASLLEPGPRPPAPCPWLLSCPSSPKHCVVYVIQPSSVTWRVDLPLLSHPWGHLS